MLWTDDKQLKVAYLATEATDVPVGRSVNAWRQLVT